MTWSFNMRTSTMIPRLYQVMHGTTADRAEYIHPARLAVRSASDTTPLRIMFDDWLLPYLERAMTGAGDVNDFKAFLPRLLELAELRSVSNPELFKQVV
jgi:hypothetical protein